MRLIDADKLLETLQDLEPHCDNKKYENGVLKMLRCYMPQIINDEPTAFDIGKVVKELESEKRYGSKYDSYYEENLYRGEMFENDVNNKTIDKAIEIVKQGGVSDDVCVWKSMIFELKKAEKTSSK